MPNENITLNVATVCFLVLNEGGAKFGEKIGKLLPTRPLGAWALPGRAKRCRNRSDIYQRHKRVERYIWKSGRGGWNNQLSKLKVDKLFPSLPH